MTDDELLALVARDDEWNDGVEMYVAVHVLNGKLIVRVEDDNSQVTVRKWRLEPTQ